MSRLPDTPGAARARLFAVVFSLGLAVAAVWLNTINGGRAGDGAVGLVTGLTLFGATFWLSWGAALVLVGLRRRRAAAVPPTLPPQSEIRGRCVIVVPICNEDPVATFSRIAAMDMGLAERPEGDRFDVAILSDTRDELTATREERWYQRLIEERGAEGRIFYRRRTSNEGKKAGNLRDFVERSGGAWDYALILDADSLMETGTMVEMLRRMEADPKLGLLQTPPTVIGAETRFGRMMQFGAALFSPVFARGTARMQGDTGPFWGHNAMVRMRAFAECCGLPALPGRPPFGGHILSHDYVEAALLARGGWRVRLDEDLAGSYEEGPANILEHAKRDRRWCQGNLQHARLLTTPRLRLWSRFVFVQGILAYVASLFWLGFLAATIAGAALPAEVTYYPDPAWPFPVFPGEETTRASELALGVVGLLVLPKLLILIEAIATGRARRFGGPLRTGLSMIAELAMACLIAPVLLMFQTRAILEILSGRDAGWPTGRGRDGRVTAGQAWMATGWITIAGLALVAAAAALTPALLPWLAPVAGPMTLAPLIVSWSSHPSRHRGLFRVPQERAPAAVIRRQRRVFAAWTAPGAVAEAEAEADIPRKGAGTGSSAGSVTHG